jgi:hypothetical protein
MAADLAANRAGGASVFAKLFSIVWQKDGDPPGDDHDAADFCDRR